MSRFLFMFLFFTSLLHADWESPSGYTGIYWLDYNGECANYSFGRPYFSPFHGLYRGCVVWEPPGTPCDSEPNTTWDQASESCKPIDKEKGEGQCPQGNPINTATGNKYQIETDYTGGGLFPLSVTRTYNSLSGNWQFLPQAKPSTDNTELTVVQRDGKGLTFVSDGDGSWLSDPDVTGVLESLEDGVGNITGWRYTNLENLVMNFNIAGQLLSETNRAGISHNYSHTVADITVSHSQGGILVFQLDSSGRIIGFTTPDNQQYTYSYDTEDRLASITYPNASGNRIYHYEDVNFLNALTGITDANGNQFATWAYDSLGRAISSEHNDGAEKVTLDYYNLYDITDPRVTTTNALGKKTTYHFTTIHGVKKVTEVEGHQSANCEAANKAYTYDTNGFLESKTDWKGTVTRYVRNAKGQELSRTEAEGSPQERTITTEWHTTFNLPTKITEPERETVIDYDPNGNELSRVVTDASGT